MVRWNYRGNFVLVLGKVISLKGIYDEYTTGDGYGDGDYAYDGYPGNVLNWPNWDSYALHWMISEIRKISKKFLEFYS